MPEEETTPEEIMPEETTPEETMPEETAPEGTMPAENIGGGTMPEDGGDDTGGGDEVETQKKLNFQNTKPYM